MKRIAELTDERIKVIKSNIAHIINWNKNHLTFDEQKHEYQVDNVVVKSVSYLIKPFNKDFHEKLKEPYFKRIIEKAALRGSRVHKATELLDANGLVFNDAIKAEYNDVKKYLISYKKHQQTFLKDHTLLAIELVMYSKHLNICGTIDRLYINNLTSEIVLLDIKTGKTQDVNWYQQLVYKQLLDEWNIGVKNLTLLSLWQNSKLSVPNTAKIKYFNKVKDTDTYISKLNKVLDMWKEHNGIKGVVNG